MLRFYFIFAPLERKTNICRTKNYFLWQTYQKKAIFNINLDLPGYSSHWVLFFGDIGTSPLYVMKAIIHTGEALDENYVLGALSCIIWTLTLQTTVKYVLVALRADNNGEGGILALYALLRRHRRRWIYIIAIIGASTLLADGIITPAITVTTAIEGLESYQSASACDSYYH